MTPASSYEIQRYHLLHEMRTLRAKARLGLQIVGERRHIIKTMALLRKARAPIMDSVVVAPSDH